MKNKILALSVVLGVAFIAVGIFTGGNSVLNISKSGFDFGEVNIQSEEIIYAISDDIINIDVDTAYNDVYIVSGSQFTLSYSSEDITVTESDGTLIVDDKEVNGNFITFGLFSITENKDELFLIIPEYISLDNINISVNSGNVKIINQDAQTLSVENDYGDIELSEITADNIVIDQNSGDLDVLNVSTESLNIESTYGDIYIENLSSTSLSAVLNSGDLTCSNSNITDINLKNQYGDITIELIGNEENYTIDLTLVYGDFRLNGEKISANDIVLGTGENKIEIVSNSGDVSIDFINE